MRLSAGIACMLPLFALGQSGLLNVRLDTTVIRIGEQTTLRVEVAQPPGTLVEWPIIADTLNAHVEVVHDSGVDTVSTDQELIRQVRTLRITSFDSGLWAVPPFLFSVNGRPLETKPLLLEVRTVQVNLSTPLHEIKDIHVLPFSLTHWIREHLLWLAIALGVLGIALVVFLYLNKKRAPAPVVTATAQPLHERILSALRALEAEQVWQQGNHKVYHSRLTDLLRAYLEERYRVAALERTTDELLRELRVSPLSNDQRGQLENMLRLADLVKFAKARPSPQENEQMMIGAMRFVQDTAPLANAQEHA